MKRQRILLVDDQPLVLLGLERLLRRMRSVWDVTVAESGRKACELLEAQAFDVLVTDLNMPGFNGKQVLEWTLEHRPSVVRIVLSGHQDKRLIEGSAHLAHRFLTKPCEPGVLAEVLEQVSQLQDLPPEARRRVAGTVRLPSSPVACHRIRTCADNPESPLIPLRELVLTDPGLAAKTLQLVNSAVFGAPRLVVDPWEALQILTREELAGLEAEPVSPEQEARLRPLREAGLRIARTARAITKAEGAPAAIQTLARTAGLLTVAGPMLLALEPMPPEAPPLDLAGLSRQHLNLLGLPAPLLDLVGSHREPARAGNGASLALAAVHVAAIRPGEIPDEVFLADHGWLPRLAAWRSLPLSTEDEP